MANEGIKQAIPNIAILVILLLTLLGVLTYYQFISCSDVPGWCPVYCSMAGKSRVALLYGTEGIGNPDLLRTQIINQRFIPVETISVDTASAALLKKYDLVIVEHAKRITPAQSDAILEYLRSGKPAIWIGDAGTERYLSNDDLTLAKQRNASQPGYYEQLVKQVNESKGFGDISNALGAQYVSTKTGPATATLTIVDRDHKLTRGLTPQLTLPISAYATVSFTPAAALKIADLKVGSDTIPGLLESRYAGKILYSSIPLEELPKAGYTTVLDNAMSYLVTCG
ncbi:MAG TPA: hypothetical protein VGQ00_03790 [Candidatus Norongarragalinales archaeon]|jgi:hypothetical protein|nr:hypothetical protein [Candidatus Norongarragalinales archaeon]